MGTPFPLLAIICVYLWIVYEGGPVYMKNRPAYNLTWIVRFYNAFQVLVCLGFVVRSHQFESVSYKYIWKCTADKVLSTNEPGFVVGWYYLLLRITELVETIFFILRKKQNQISGLHIYHHISTIFLFWAFFKYSSSI